MTVQEKQFKNSTITMLITRLRKSWQSGKFAPSWIVGASDIELALNSIKDFTKEIMSCGDLPIENNPDFLVVKRELNSSGENLAKHITVDQIRALQKFFSTTNAVAPYKVVVIHEADLMNVNASNCCLKILEDTPQNSLIFLITRSPSSLLLTIRSRCSVIHSQKGQSTIDHTSYNDSLMLLADNRAFIDKLGSKLDRDSLRAFAVDILHLLNRLVKGAELTSEEEMATKCMGTLSFKSFMNKFECVSKIMNEAGQYDLDPRTCFILIAEAVKG